MADKNSIIKDVKVILYRDQNGTALSSVSGMASIEQTKADALIERLISPAIDKVFTFAPTWMLRGIAQKLDDDQIDWYGDEEDLYASVGAIDSSEVIRIIQVKASNWKRPVLNMTSFDDALYSQYRSPYAGIRPTEYEPAVAVGLDWEDDAFRLECYPKKEVNGTISVKAILTSKEQRIKDLTIPEKCYNSVVYTIASLWYEATGDKSRSDMMAAEAVQMLNIETTETT